MKHKAFFNWSGGKDSALALHKAQQDGIAIDALVTSVNSTTDRVAMHGVRRELLMQQAAAIGLPLYTIELSEMPGMKAYEEAVHATHQKLKDAGFTHGGFGDIFLEDLKTYREELLSKDELQCFFPIWKMDTKKLLEQFIEEGFKAIIVCVNSAYLNESFCGRLLDNTFLNDLPATVDPCGENGEYHSFVFDGPIFSQAIPFRKGEVVFKEYAAPIVRPCQPELAEGKDGKAEAQGKSDDCFTTPQSSAGFYFQDLIIV
ncbi:MAG: diphthine--ammonia ligase [Flavisolibacter sp.]|nr:diphthine--ammonia ligase [Flavisolibacter sp.]